MNSWYVTNGGCCTGYGAACPTTTVVDAIEAFCCGICIAWAGIVWTAERNNYDITDLLTNKGFFSNFTCENSLRGSSFATTTIVNHVSYDHPKYKG